jgi:pilus assembly protein CpaE
MMDLTTINKNSSHRKGAEIHLGKIAIISSRPHVTSGITTQLRMNGSYDFVTIDSAFTDDFDDNELTVCEYTIIDIEDFRDVAEIERKIKFLIPITIKKIFVGDVDSISFYNEMKRIGVSYLHLDSQMMQLGVALKNTETKENVHTQKISILGCKGGSGASLVSWWFFQAIGALSHLPILLVQGHTGSPDLDLITDIAIQRDGIITPINAHQSLKIATEEEQWQFDDPNFNYTS